MLLNLIYVIVGAALVLVGADKLTDGAVAVARRFHIPEIVIGLTIVGFGTSLPEFMVSLLAGIQGASDMSVGNIVGSNLFNILVIIGCSALFTPLVVSRATLSKDLPFTLLSSIALPALAMDMLMSGGTFDVISLGDGIVLLCFFAIFMRYTFAVATAGKDVAATAEESEVMPVWKMVVYIVLGLAALVFGGRLFVDGSCGLARLLGVSEAVIGLTLVAGGTSLPELAVSIIAARKGKSDMAIGNVIGSVLFNTFWVLGFCACIHPLTAGGIVWTDYVMLIFASLLFWLFARTKRCIGRWEGAVMVACYVVYLSWLILS